MKYQISTNSSKDLKIDEWEQRVVNSALWAAGGDALGWMTELSYGQTGVKRRTGISKVSEPLPWQRVIGGRNGPKVDFPAGTYSDDTQLRLAVSRSIRGNGFFDVETFAKIELTIWPTYALGAGLGSKAAALNLSRRGVNWFSNFYESGSQRYISGGGNGAAMRIQPHVWSSIGSLDEIVHNVLRDALVTHGHPQGFCGAVFHALCLSQTLRTGMLPKIDEWLQYVDYFQEIPKLIENDSQLAAFWRTSWEQNFGSSLESALDEVCDQARFDLDEVAVILSKSEENQYHHILMRLGCLEQKFRGSGLKTAIAAVALAHLYKDRSVHEALTCAANELESDTDTIATMCGALMGCFAIDAPKWKIQDLDYLTSEAKRLTAIAFNKPQPSFTYPDLGHWNPPNSQMASVGRFEEGFAIAGLGVLIVDGIKYQSGDAIWQWATLPFGQTILAKRKANLIENILLDQLPSSINKTTDKEILNVNSNSSKVSQKSLFIDNTIGKTTSNSLNKIQITSDVSTSISLDLMTDQVIHSNFDDAVFGRLLNNCIDTSQSIELAAAFVAIIAKAKIARQRRKR